MGKNSEYGNVHFLKISSHEFSVKSSPVELKYVNLRTTYKVG